MRRLSINKTIIIKYLKSEEKKKKTCQIIYIKQEIFTASFKEGKKKSKTFSTNLR